MANGRPAVTNRSELEVVALRLFTENGFDQTTVDDIAAEAGVSRRTFFRYFASKNDAVWGDFEAALEHLRSGLGAVAPQTPMMEGLRDAVLDFNHLEPEGVDQHQQRMALILRTPALQAHSTIRYAGWRDVICEYVGARLGLPADDFEPRLLGALSLAAAVSAYERWLDEPTSELPKLLSEAFDRLATGWQ